MTVHPRSLPSCPLASQSGHVPVEVPGLAYYSTGADLTAPVRPQVQLSIEAQALDQMFGYYSQPD